MTKASNPKKTKSETTKNKEPQSLLTDKLLSEIELLKRHIIMLKAIRVHAPVGIIRLSEITRFPQHRVRYSLRILEQERLIEASPGGAVPTRKVERFMDSLRTLLEEIEHKLKALKRSIE